MPDSLSPSLGDLAGQAPFLPSNPADPRYSMPLRLLSAGNQVVLQPILNSLSVFGDVARGQASMSDPITQQRLMGAANLATGGMGNRSLSSLARDPSLVGDFPRAELSPGDGPMTREFGYGLDSQWRVAHSQLYDVIGLIDDMHSRGVPMEQLQRLMETRNFWQDRIEALRQHYARYGEFPPEYQYGGHQ